MCRSRQTVALALTGRTSRRNLRCWSPMASPPERGLPAPRSSRCAVGPPRGKMPALRCCGAAAPFPQRSLRKSVDAYARKGETNSRFGTRNLFAFCVNVAMVASCMHTRVGWALPSNFNMLYRVSFARRNLWVSRQRPKWPRRPEVTALRTAATRPTSAPEPDRERQWGRPLERPSHDHFAPHGPSRRSQPTRPTGRSAYVLIAARSSFLISRRSLA